MVEVEEHARLGAGVALIHEHSAPAQQVAVPLQRQVNGCVEQRVTRAHKGRERLALWRDNRLLEDDPLVTRQDRFPNTNDAVAVADRRRYMRDFIAPRFRCLAEPPSR